MVSSFLHYSRYPWHNLMVKAETFAGLMNVHKRKTQKEGIRSKSVALTLDMLDGFHKCYKWLFLEIRQGFIFEAEWTDHHSSSFNKLTAKQQNHVWSSNILKARRCRILESDTDTHMTLVGHVSDTCRTCICEVSN